MTQRVLQSHYDEVERARLEANLAFLMDAVADASNELYQGGLSYRAGEKLAREVTSLKAEIGRLQRRLRELASA